VIGWEDLVSWYLSCRTVPLQRPDWRVIRRDGLLCVFPTRNIVNFLVNFTYLTATYFLKARDSLFVLKVPLNPNKSINLKKNEKLFGAILSDSKLTNFCSRVLFVYRRLTVRQQLPTCKLSCVVVCSSRSHTVNGRFISGVCFQLVVVIVYCRYSVFRLLCVRIQSLITSGIACVWWSINGSELITTVGDTDVVLLATV